MPNWKAPFEQSLCPRPDVVGYEVREVVLFAYEQTYVVNYFMLHTALQYYIIVL